MFGKRGLFGNPAANSLASLAAQYPAQTQPNALSDWLNPTAHRAPSPQKATDYGKRVDGTPKARGFLGEIPTPDGKVMTELSIGVDIGDGEEEIPSLVPSLTREEIEYLRRGGKPTGSIVDKAVEHARKRKQMGLSPFAMRGVDY